MAYGQESNLGISFQNSYGTANLTSLHWIPKISESMALEKPPLIEQSLRGVFDEGAHHEGFNVVNGTVEVEAAPIPLGVMLQAVLGEPVTVTSGSVYAHTFKPATADFDEFSAGIPLTVIRQLGVGSMDYFSDMNGNALTLSVANGEFVKASVDFVGGQHTQVTPAAVTVTYPTTVLWSWDATSVSIGGAAKTEMMDMSLTLNEAIEAKGTLHAAKTPSRNKRTGFRTLEVSGTLVFDNANEYQAFLDQDERELILHFEGVTEIQSGYNEALTIKVPLMRHTDFKPTAGGPGELEVGFSSKGVYSVTSATALQVELRNTQAAY